MSPEGCQRIILRLSSQRLLLNICTSSIQVNLLPVDAVTNVDDVGWQNMVAPGDGRGGGSWQRRKESEDVIQVTVRLKRKSQEGRSLRRFGRGPCTLHS